MVDRVAAAVLVVDVDFTHLAIVVLSRFRLGYHRLLGPLPLLVLPGSGDSYKVQATRQFQRRPGNRPDDDVADGGAASLTRHHLKVIRDVASRFGRTERAWWLTALTDKLVSKCQRGNSAQNAETRKETPVLSQQAAGSEREAVPDSSRECKRQGVQEANNRHLPMCRMHQFGLDRSDLLSVLQRRGEVPNPSF